jgi:phosphoglycerate dehydrogenase-like enzyme
LGAGGITLSLLAQLEPFTPAVTILRRKAEPLEDELIPDKLKDRVQVATLADLDKYIPEADIIVAACALTPDTKFCLAKKQFELMQEHAIVVNVARGEVIHTDDLVDALREGIIGGAGLDVTFPEPLASNHPLWKLESKHKSMDVEVEKGGKKANLIIVSKDE